MTLTERITDLRARAARLAQAAEHSDDRISYASDMDRARRLRACADRLAVEAKGEPRRIAHRTAQLGAIHQGKKALGMDDATYRAMLDRVTTDASVIGIDTAAALTERERDAVLDELRRLGWAEGAKAKRRERRPSVPLDRDALMGKVEALLAEKKRLEGTSWTSWKYADAIAKRVAGVDAVRFADASGLLKVVQALTYHVKRLEAAGTTPPAGGAQ